MNAILVKGQTVQPQNIPQKNSAANSNLLLSYPDFVQFQFNRNRCPNPLKNRGFWA